MGKRNRDVAVVLVDGGLEEAEMFARFAQETIHYEGMTEADVAAVEALIEKSRAILRRLIDEATRPKQKRENLSEARAVLNLVARSDGGEEPSHG